MVAKSGDNTIPLPFNNTVINHLYYADDLCLLSPSAVGLSELLLVTERFAVANEIIFKG